MFQRILYNKDGKAEWNAMVDGEEYIDPDVIFDLEEEFLWDIARHLISTNPPSVVADKLDIPEFAALHKLTPLPKSMKLQQIGDIYLNRKKKPLRKQEFEDSERWWGQFGKLTKVKTVRDITLKEIRRYQNGCKVPTKYSPAKKKDGHYIQGIRRLVLSDL